MALRKTRTGKWITVAAAAERLGVNPLTIRRRIADRTLPAYTIRNSGARSPVRIDERDVDALLERIPTVDSVA